MRQPGRRVGARARARVGLAEQRAAARRRAERHHARAVRVRGQAARPLLARRRRDVDRGRRGIPAERAVERRASGSPPTTAPARRSPRSSASPSATPPLDPETCTPATPEPGYTMLFDGTRASTEAWRMAGPGSISRGERLHAVHRGRAGAALAHDADRPPLLAQARLEDGGRRQLGRVRRLPRPGHRSVGRGRPRLRDPDRRHGRPGQHDRRGLQLPGRGHRPPGTRRSTRPGSGTATSCGSRASGSASTSTAR